MVPVEAGGGVQQLVAGICFGHLCHEKTGCGVLRLGLHVPERSEKHESRTASMMEQGDLEIADAERISTADRVGFRRPWRWRQEEQRIRP